MLLCFDPDKTCYANSDKHLDEFVVCVLFHLRQYTRTKKSHNIIALYAISDDVSCTTQTTSGDIHHTTMFAGFANIFAII